MTQHDSFTLEMKLLMYVGRHVNVLSLLGVVTENMEHGALYAILEFCEFGSLFDYIRQVAKKRAQKVMSSWC